MKQSLADRIRDALFNLWWNARSGSKTEKLWDAVHFAACRMLP